MLFSQKYFSQPKHKKINNLTIDNLLRNSKIVGVNTPDYYEALVDRIRGAIKKRGLTYAELALALGKSKGWVSQVVGKNPTTKLTVPALLEIARVLNMPPAALIPFNSASTFPVGNDFDNYVRNIVQEEIAKYNSNKGDP